MPGNCSVCGVSLYGEEIEIGLCEKCKAGVLHGTNRTNPLATTYDEDHEYLPSNGPSFSVRDASWGMVHTGVCMMFGSVLTFLICSIIIQVLLVLMFSQRRPPLFQIYDMMAPCLSLVLVSGITGVVAVFLCCSVPRVSAARGLAVAARWCLLVGLVLGFLHLFLIVGSIGYRGGNNMFHLPWHLYFLMVFANLVLVGLMSLTTWILLLLLLSGVARELASTTLASQLLIYLVVSLIASLLQVIATLIVGFTGIPALRERLGIPRPGYEVLMLLEQGWLCLMILMGLALMIWFLALLNRLAGLLARPWR